MQHYESRLKKVLGKADCQFALAILTNTAVNEDLGIQTLNKYRSHFSIHNENEGNGAPSVVHVMRVLQHDGYLELRDGRYRFISGLLEDWWKIRQGQKFAPCFDRQQNRSGASL